MFRMLKPKLIETKLSIFRRDLVEDGRFSISVGYVKIVGSAKQPSGGIFCKNYD